MSASFEDFLSAMSAEEHVELSGQGNSSLEVDTATTATENGWEFDEEKQQLLEDLGLVDEDEEEFDTEEPEEGEEEEAEDVPEGFDFVMEDWDSSIVLPNGVELTANQLQNYTEFDNKVMEFEQTAREVREREQLLAQNTEVGIAALNHIEQGLTAVARQRPLNVLEQAQYQTLQQMKEYYTNTTDAFAATHSRTINETKAKTEAEFNANLDICFTKYPNLDKDIGTIREYLTEKGVPNPGKYLNDIRMDPKVIDILQDAIAFKRVRDKVSKPAARVARGAIKGTSNSVRSTPDAYTGISSHDLQSYTQFESIFGKDK